MICRLMKEWDGERQSFPEISEDLLAPDEGFIKTAEAALDGTPVPSDEEIIADFLDAPLPGDK